MSAPLTLVVDGETNRHHSCIPAFFDIGWLSAFVSNLFVCARELNDSRLRGRKRPARSSVLLDTELSMP